MSGWDGENNENMYEQFGVGVTVKGVECGVVEGVKGGALRLSGYMMRMGKEFLKCMNGGLQEGVSGEEYL